MLHFTYIIASIGWGWVVTSFLYTCIFWMTEVKQNANHIELIAICCDARLKLKLPVFTNSSYHTLSSS